MTTPRLSRFLGGIFALCYLSSITVIIWFCAFNAFNAAMAGAFLSVTPTPCPKPAPNLAPSLVQSGTIKSTSGQTLQIIPKTPGTPITATYSHTTRITEQILITTPSASVLQKGINVSIVAMPNPNGTFTAALITLRPGNQLDNLGCSAGNPSPELLSPGTAHSIAPHSSTSLPGTKPVPANTPNTPKKSFVRLEDQLGGGGCFADGGPTQKAAPVAPTPTPSANKQSTCWIISGTVEQLKGNTLTVIDRQHTSYIVTLTSGANAAMIIKITPATPSALKVGTSVTVVGPVNKGVIAALEITIGTL